MYFDLWTIEVATSNIYIYICLKLKKVHVKVDVRDIGRYTSILLLQSIKKSIYFNLQVEMRVKDHVKLQQLIYTGMDMG